jgi:thiamine-phosphate pyrophosphorylase
MSNTSRKQLVLHVLTDRELSHDRDTLTVASAALDGGATVIQLRDKKASTRTLVEEGQALRALTRERGALLIVNDRIDVALAIEADGAHIGQDDDMPIALARKLLGPDRILGISAGNLKEADVAVTSGADYLGVGPIYATKTKADAGEPIGLSLLTELASRYSTPIIAIGSIKADNAAAVLQAGALGIAVIRAVVSAEDITSATHELRDSMTIRKLPER